MKRATLRASALALRGSISIHALVKRATDKQMAKIFYSVISIHALVKRATVCIILTFLKLLIFQSTPS